MSNSSLDDETWQRKLADQTDNEEAIIESLTELFKEMRRLEYVEIRGPQFSEDFFGDMDLYQYCNTPGVSSCISG